MTSYCTEAIDSTCETLAIAVMILASDASGDSDTSHDSGDNSGDSHHSGDNRDW